MVLPASLPGQVLGKYALYDAIASGGMARIHLGRVVGPAGFSRTVVIKRLHPQFASEPEFVAMLLDEARLSARLRHPNVVPTLDVIAENGEVFLVMEYVHGASLSRLVRAMSDRPVPAAYVANVIAGVLHGLHAAHEATDGQGKPLGLVHRDISPQNVLVSVEGVGRVIDFGVAKAIGRLQTTRDGALKGKMSYMAPEQLRGEAFDHRVDVYAVGVVLWEALTGRRLFSGESDVVVFGKVLGSEVPAPSTFAPALPSGLDEIVLRALDRKPENRFPSAKEMARAIENCVPLVGPGEIGEWVQSAAAEDLNTRAQLLAAIEAESDVPVLATSASREPAASIPVEMRTLASKVIRKRSRHAVLGLGIAGAMGIGMLLLAVLARPSPTAHTPTAVSGVAPSLPTSTDSTPPAPAPPTDTPVSIALPPEDATTQRVSQEPRAPQPTLPKKARLQRPRPSTAAVLDTRE